MYKKVCRSLKPGKKNKNKQTKTTFRFFIACINKLWYTCNGILFSNKKNRLLIICNLENLFKNYAEKNSDTKEYMMWYLTDVQLWIWQTSSLVNEIRTLFAYGKWGPDWQERHRKVLWDDKNMLHVQFLWIYKVCAIFVNWTLINK